jgi:hypothetical protein
MLPAYGISQPGSVRVGHLQVGETYAGKTTVLSKLPVGKVGPGRTVELLSGNRIASDGVVCFDPVLCPASLGLTDFVASDAMVWESLWEVCCLTGCL